LPAAAWLGRVWLAAGVANLIFFGAVTMGFGWHMGGDAAPDDALRLRLMSFNIKAELARERRGGLTALEIEVTRHAPDVIAMQDADGLLVRRSDAPLAGGAALFGLPHVYALGQYIIASRFPLHGCGVGQIGYRDQSHRFLHCRLDIGGTLLTLVTAHFQTPRNALMAVRRRGPQGMNDWQRNVEDRLEQARHLVRALADLPRPLVVAGDLNAPETSPVLRMLLDAGLRDSFAVAGRGWGYTYGHTLRGLSFLRIDHVLVSADIGVVNSAVGGAEASEHRPVVTDLFVRRTSPRTP
jgi:vancomycin resistance protein VanJ